MIPVYESQETLSGKPIDDYAKSSTIATTSKTVRNYLKKYLQENKCNDDVSQFLKSYANDLRLLPKTHVVRDGSYRNCVILVRPDGLVGTRSGGYYEIKPEHTVQESLTYFSEHAEIIFLNMSAETWEEVNEFFNLFADMWDL